MLCGCCETPTKPGPEKYPWLGRPLIECIRFLTMVQDNPLSQRAAAQELGISQSSLRREVARHAYS